MKRMFFGAVLVLFAALAILAGCSGNSSNSPQNEGAQSENNDSGGGSTDEAVKNEPVTVKFYYYYPEELMQWEKLSAAFEKEHPNIHVEGHQLVNNNSKADFMKKLDLLASSGDELGVLFIADLPDYVRYMKLGLLEPLNAYMGNEGIHYSDTYQADLRIDGEYYALPGPLTTYLVLLNKNHLAEANLEVPKQWTWDTFREYSKILTKGEGVSKRYGTYFHTWHYDYKFPLYAQQQNNDIYKSDGTHNVEDPLVKKSLELRYNMENVDQSAVPLSTSISQKLSYRDEYLTEKVSMLVTGSWMIPEVAGTEVLPVSFPTAFAPFPQNADNQESNYTYAKPTMLAIAKNSPNKEAAYTFIRWFTTEGLDLQGKKLHSWKNTNANDIIDTILSEAKNPEMLDRESLLYTLGAAEGVTVMPPAYANELDKVYVDESEKYLLGNQDIQTALKNMKNSMDKIVESNKK